MGIIWPFLYFSRWCTPSLLLEAFGRHCPCSGLITATLVQGQIFQKFKTTWNSITTLTETHILMWIQIVRGKLTTLPHRIRFMEHRYIPLRISRDKSKLSVYEEMLKLKLQIHIWLVDILRQQYLCRSDHFEKISPSAFPACNPAACLVASVGRWP